MKAIIFDASSLISIAMNGLLEHLEKLREISNAKFILTKEVKYEAIDRPMKIKKFELEALQINELYKKGILESPSSLNIDEKRITTRTKEIQDISSTIISKRGGEKIKLIDLGEASCLALSEILTSQKINNVLAIDERTTRVLCEKPENLKKLMQRKLHTPIEIDKKNLKFLKNFKIVRSAELMFMAYKKGIFEIKDEKVLDATLYALKFKGCAISGEEIEEIKKMR